jgi:hypothetical protein
MVNSWSLAWEVLNGTMDETYPIREDIPDDLWGKKIDMSVGAGNTAHEDDGLDYEIDLTNGASADYNMSDIDDMYYHHYTNANSPYNDGWTQEYHQEQLDKMANTDHNFKYHEDEILKDIQEYVSRTYQGHYTGTKHEFRKVQTIDLMAARDIATDFCQANILKYGSRYGSKNGKNKTDLLKVIHYAMLLLHFDGHYGEPSMPSGNFDQMP